MNIDLNSLFQYGALGLMCAWFMFKITPELEEVHNSLDRFSRALMLSLSQRHDVTAAVKEQAHEILAEIDAKEDGRKK